MKTPSLVEPESLLEVRRWKEKASLKIEELGFAEYDRRNHEKFAAFTRQVEEKRLARLANEHKPAA
jgi:hypothetical protein